MGRLLIYIKRLRRIIAVFAARKVSTILWARVTALPSITIGAVLLWKPAESALSMVLAIFPVVEDVFQAAASLSHRDVLPSSWGRMLPSGLSDPVLAGNHHLDVASLGALGLIVGAKSDDEGHRWPYWRSPEASVTRGLAI